MTKIHPWSATVCTSSPSRQPELARAPDVDAQVVCFMNATPVADVVAVCDSGAVMPQKSTFFYPKIPTGLTFHSLDLER